MMSQYFITQPQDVPGRLPTNALGQYCKPINVDINCVDYDIIYVTRISLRYAIAKHTSGYWALIDINGCEVIAQTIETGNDITQYDWFLEADTKNLGKIVINNIKNNKKRLIGRFRPLCVRCPVEGSPCNDYSYDDLAERRKIEILQYKKIADFSDFKTSNSKSSKIKYSKTINSQGNKIIDLRHSFLDCSQNAFCSENRFGKCSFILCLNPNVPYTKK